MPSIDEIRASIQTRLAETRAEVQRWEGVLAAMDQAPDDGAPPPRPRPRKPSTPAPASTPAPYGYKADGTPRKRPAPSPETQARAARSRWARRDQTSAPTPPAEAREERAAGTPPAPRPLTVGVRRPNRVALHVQTMTMPASELDGREVAWTTEAPAEMAEVA